MKPSVRAAIAAACIYTTLIGGAVAVDAFDVYDVCEGVGSTSATTNVALDPDIFLSPFRNLLCYDVFGRRCNWRATTGVDLRNAVGTGSCSFHELVEVTGDIVTGSDTPLASVWFADLVHVSGKIEHADSASLYTIHYDNVVSVGGDLTLGDLPVLGQLQFGSLETVGGDFTCALISEDVVFPLLQSVYKMTFLYVSMNTVAFASLTSVHDILVGGSAAVTTLSLPALTTATGSVTLTLASTVRTVNIDALASVNGELGITVGTTHVDTLYLPDLTYVGTLYIAGTQGLKYVSLPALSSCGSVVIAPVGSTGVAGVYMPVTPVAGDFTLRTDVLACLTGPASVSGTTFIASASNVPWGALPACATCAATPASSCPNAACTVRRCDFEQGCVYASDVICQDSDPCTVDACVGVDFCTYTPFGSLCDDGDACTADTCGDDECVYTSTASECDDNVACTADACDAGIGCTYTAQDSACATGEFCDSTDGCTAVPFQTGVARYDVCAGTGNAGATTDVTLSSSDINAHGPQFECLDTHGRQCAWRAMAGINARTAPAGAYVFVGLVAVVGEVETYTAAGVTGLFFPALTTVSTGLDHAFSSALETLWYPRLQTVDGAIFGADLPSLSLLHAPLLATVGGKVELYDVASDIVFPSLAQAAEVHVARTDGAVVAMPNITATAVLRIYSSPGVHDILLQSLTTVSGVFYVYPGPVCETLDFSSLASVSGSLQMGASAPATLHFPSLVSADSVTLFVADGVENVIMPALATTSSFAVNVNTGSDGITAIDVRALAVSGSFTLRSNVLECRTGPVSVGGSTTITSTSGAPLAPVPECQACDALEGPECSDGVGCTTDTCMYTGGCIYTPRHSACDDGDACTADACDADSGCYATSTESLCDDGVGCTSDTCDTASGCTYTPRHSLCDDAIACTADACDADSGCIYTPHDSACDDGDACTADACDAQSGCYAVSFASDCDDGVACTSDSCDASSGCAYAPEDSACDDSDVCTADYCDANSGCYAVSFASVCDDGHSCTSDSCDAALGCVYTLDPGVCDDGDACTAHTCVDEECVTDSIGSTCDDGIACTADSCDAASGCIYTPRHSACDDAVNCTVDSCDTDTGCRHDEADSLCDDGFACSIDICDYRFGCVHIYQDAACDDGKACTLDSCSEDSGCTHALQNSICDDGDPCTNDVCRDSECVHSSTAYVQFVCDDDIDCTVDGCDTLSGCTYTPADSVCADDDACTLDVCDIASGCTSTPAASLCDDNVACTTDACDSGAGCTYTPHDSACDDDNLCTLDYCDADSGCYHISVPDDPATDCSSALGVDVLRCGAGVCVAGACVIDTATTCNSSDPCTTSLCYDDGGGYTCLYATADSGNWLSTCDDGNACTLGDRCYNTQGDITANHTCMPVSTKDCDDGNACTADSCDGPAPNGTNTGACVHNATARHGSACDDGNACTLNDTCAHGTCMSLGGNATCSDGIACTLDTCDPVSGCVYTPLHSACDDANACTTDTCDPVSGCVFASVSSICDDGNNCTLDVCDPDSGCIYTAVADDPPLACNLHLGADYMKCGTTACVAGTCVREPLGRCDTDRQCTYTTCARVTSAYHCIYFTAHDSTWLSACDDGDACTLGDRCYNTRGDIAYRQSCMPTHAGECNDGDPCTVDVCDGETGCTHTLMSRDKVVAHGLRRPLCCAAPPFADRDGDGVSDCDETIAFRTRVDAANTLPITITV